MNCLQYKTKLQKINQKNLVIEAKKYNINSLGLKKSDLIKYILYAVYPEEMYDLTSLITNTRFEIIARFINTTMGYPRIYYSKLCGIARINKLTITKKSNQGIANELIYQIIKRQMDLYVQEDKLLRLSGSEIDFKQKIYLKRNYFESNLTYNKYRWIMANVLDIPEHPSHDFLKRYIVKYFTDKGTKKNFDLMCSYDINEEGYSLNTVLDYAIDRGHIEVSLKSKKVYIHRPFWDII